MKIAKRLLYLQCIKFEEMKLKFITLILFVIFPFIVEAQKDIRKECVPTTMFSATYSYQFPGADTKILYKNNSTVGASVIYKTDKARPEYKLKKGDSSNWM